MEADTARVELAGEVSRALPGRRYEVVLIRAGEWRGKGMRCSAGVLRAAVVQFDGVASFLNPPPPQPGQHGHPGLERLLGVTENAAWDEAEQGIRAGYRLADTDAARWFGSLMDGWLASRAAGQRVPEIGLSAVLWARLGQPTGSDGLREVEEVLRVEQVDAVYRPAAGGEFVRVLNGTEFIGGTVGDEHSRSDRPPHRSIGEAGMEEAPQVNAAADESTDELRAALREGVLEARLAASGLPAGYQRTVRETLPAAWRVAELDATVQRVKAAWAAEEGKRAVQGVRPLVSGVQDGLDQIGEALTALLSGRSPRAGIRPLSGIREAYMLLSGDYEMKGTFQGERVYLANVNSTTMSNLVANVMNKVVAQEFQQYPRWWEPIVSKESFGSLQSVKWIVLGGIGELPAVAEGAAYSELTWDDASETAVWQKHGGYLGITIEAIDKDDTARLRNAPRGLAQAAWLTLGKSVASIFTDNAGAGPTLADAKALFHADHGNLGAAALDATSWAAAKLAMRKQTELNSGERFGALTSPRFLLVPAELENAALTLLASENMPGTANNDVNSDAEGSTRDARLDAARRRIVVVDLWTDTNNWAALADPRLYPTIGLGFRYGETPEVFSVQSPTQGLMFTNDVMPVKVRWFYACGPKDHRGMYKANVA